MDDIKVYAQTRRQLNQPIKTVKILTADIRLDFGLDKCGMLNFRHGKAEFEGSQTQAEITEPTTETDTYKYLGILQSRHKVNTLRSRNDLQLN